ncbi:uncharacterized protein SPPG_00293 [Spizellomyces punctatus DAOM BR117]|uniref:Bromo domain-containing protein n=1 Tax=Spizellomyces punctatus (strain DAOM BR117) TaxID=645134 RepID=A0A0L0HU21_SPIPD|nr:hypothetical protein, variant [Spizellomyces punctatus DAOM BR117]XP_016612611.1 uncharacterized protein SPPG_00293 [Spizellomyces punctatus DAOM BR117]KND04571.1 hypothetical protein, variant [Spizellomyces punctatus DAOM BR117]KND04572.1 hypothetical protein SPPG_00293 [Spizellomyces punctatus DAOM BR117]|eukprot:XP_016612610.1 hypothetical protein, variant [Spizellomyces punctatus DAOM BR117]
MTSPSGQGLSFSSIILPRLKAQFENSGQASNSVSKSPTNAAAAIERDVLFLVARFLSGSKLRRTFDTLREELSEFEPGTPPSEQEFLLPTRVDWTGRRHHQTYEELANKNPHITASHLPQLIERLTAIAGQTSCHSWLGSQKSLLGIGLGSLCTNLDGVHRKSPDERRRDQPPPFQIRDMELSQLPRPRADKPLRIFYRRFETMLTTRGHMAAAYNLLWDRTGTTFFTGGDDSLVKVWCAQSGLLMRTLRGHATFLEENGQPVEHHFIADMAINEENTMLATASSDGTVHVWNVQTWDPVICLQIRKSISRIMFSPSPVDDNQCLIVGSKDGKTRVYRWIPHRQTFDPKPIILQTHDKRIDQVDTLAFNRTGTRFVVGGTDGLIYLYKIIPKSWAPIDPFQQQALAEDGDERFTCTLLSRLEASSLDYQDKPKKQTNICVKELKFSHSGDRFISGCADGTAMIWQPDTVTKAWIGQKLLPAEDQQRSAAPQKVPADRQNHDSASDVTSAEPSQGVNGGPNVMSNGAPNGIPYLDPQSALVNISIPPSVSDNSEASSGAPVVMDGIPLGGGSVNIGVTVQTNETPIPVIPPQEGVTEVEEIPGITALCWSLDDSRVITIMADRLVRVWDSYTGELLHTVKGHTNPAWILDCHPKDTRVVLSAGHDGKLIIWDIIAGRELKSFEFDDALLEASFSLDGDTIAAVDLIGQTHLLGAGKDSSDYTRNYDQFFPSDFTMVRLQPDGSLLDVQNNVAPHLVRQGNLVDIRQSPYFIDYPALRHRHKLDRSLPIDHDYIVEEREVKLLLIDEERRSVPFEQENAWTEEKNKKRRRARTAANTSWEPDLELLEALNTQDPIIPLPQSSGDEYTGEEEESAEDNDWADGSDISVSADDDNFVVDDDDDVGGSNIRRKRKSPKKGSGAGRKRRKRQRASDDEEDMARSSRRKARVSSYKEDVNDDDDDYLASEDEDDDDDNNDDDHRDVQRVDKGKRAANAKTSERSRRVKATKKKAVPLPAAITVPSEWVSMVEPKRTPYLPQIGDMVAYVKKGHIQFLEQAVDKGVAIQFDVDDSRPEVVFGEVDKLSFYPGDPVTCSVSLHVHEDETNRGNLLPTRKTLKPVLKGGRKDVLKVHFWDLEGCSDFIILFDNYVNAMHGFWKEGDEVLADYSDGLYQGRIERVLHQESPWCKFLVRWEEAPFDTEAMSAWELHRPDADHDEIPEERLNGEEMSRICEILLEWKNRDDMALFIEEVPYEDYPTYLVVNPYPMFLDRIIQRLGNAFYRKVEAVAWDVDVMIQNAKRFNEQGSAPYSFAENILPQLRDEIMGDTLSRNNRKWSISSAPSTHDKKPPKLKLVVRGSAASDSDEFNLDEGDRDVLFGSVGTSASHMKTPNQKRKRVIDDEDDDEDEYRESGEAEGSEEGSDEDEDAVGSSEESDGVDYQKRPSPKRRRSQLNDDDSEYQRSPRKRNTTRTRRESINDVVQLPSPPANDGPSTAKKVRGRRKARRVEDSSDSDWP